MDFRLRWLPNDRGGHEDLVLQFGEETHRQDVYYLALDGTVPEDGREGGGELKVRRVLRLLLWQWRARVAALGRGNVTYLPWDFSDEHIGWIQVRRGHLDDALLLTTGWSQDTRGCELAPARLGDAVPPSWDRNGRSVQLLPEEFDAGIDASMGEAAAPALVQECADPRAAAWIQDVARHVGRNLVAARVWDQVSGYPAPLVDELAGFAGLWPSRAGWSALSRQEARRHAAMCLETDLAYGTAHAAAPAEMIAEALLELLPRGTRFYSNVARAWGSTWTPHTQHTFDTGLIATAKGRHVVLWVCSED